PRPVLLPALPRRGPRPGRRRRRPGRPHPRRPHRGAPVARLRRCPAAAHAGHPGRAARGAHPRLPRRPHPHRHHPGRGGGDHRPRRLRADPSRAPRPLRRRARLCHGPAGDERIRNEPGMARRTGPCRPLRARGHRCPLLLRRSRPDAAGDRHLLLGPPARRATGCRATPDVAGRHLRGHAVRQRARRTRRRGVRPALLHLRPGSAGVARLAAALLSHLIRPLIQRRKVRHHMSNTAIAGTTDSRRLPVFVALSAILIGTVYGYDTGSIASAILFIEPEFELSTFMTTMVVSSVTFGTLAGALVGGWIANAVGRKRTMVGVAVSYTLFTGGQALAVDEWSLIAVRLLLGLVVGISIV